MARKTYSEEFRRQAVELYESTPGATFRGIAADLGITRNTLKDWVTSAGQGIDGQHDGQHDGQPAGEHERHDPQSFGRDGRLAAARSAAARFAAGRAGRVAGPGCGPRV